MAKMKLARFLLVPAVMLLASCSDHYWKGADIGWATEYEANGQYFYNAAGERRECTDLPSTGLAPSRQKDGLPS